MMAATDGICQVRWRIVHGLAGAHGRAGSYLQTYLVNTTSCVSGSALLYRLPGATLSNRGAPVSCGSRATCEHPVHLTAQGQPFLSFFAGAGRLRSFLTTLLLVNFVSSWFETHPCRVCSTDLSPNGEGVCTSHTPHYLQTGNRNCASRIAQVSWLQMASRRSGAPCLRCLLMTTTMTIEGRSPLHIP
jgi:hypothetical protein